MDNHPKVPRLAVAIRSKNVSLQTVIYALKANNAFALDIISVDDWITSQAKQDHDTDLLWIRKDGSFIYAADEATKTTIVSELASTHH